MFAELLPLYRYYNAPSRASYDSAYKDNLNRPDRSFAFMNLGEDEDNIYVRMEVPGVEIKDIDITLEKNSLVVKGTRNPLEAKYHRRERAYGNFERRVALNTNVKREDVKAAVKNGILTITLPKAEETKPKKIDIQ